MRKCFTSVYGIGGIGIGSRLGLGLVLASLAAAVSPIAFGQYAGGVVSYTPGTGAAAGFDQAGAALGEPSRATAHEFGGPVDPFNPPFLNTQLVSIGASGSLTLEFAAPIRNDPTHAFGMDFVVYGNAGFIFSDFAAGKTDGTLFGADATATRVSVSADNVTYYALDTVQAPRIDGYFPTDGAGLFGQPVNPALANAAAFDGLTLDGIRALYAGSAGGAGFDIAWARDGQGNAVALDDIRFVRLEVLSGHAEIDGIAAVPEPGTMALLALGAAGLLLRKRSTK
jgi:hypothetical protein